MRRYQWTCFALSGVGLFAAAPLTAGVVSAIFAAAGLVIGALQETV